MIVFPAGLLERLNDGELSAALAHELAHFSLRRASWCSACNLSKLELVSPAALLSAEYLHREEEKAGADQKQTYRCNINAPTRRPC